MRVLARAIKEVGKGLLKFEFPTRSPHCGTSRYAGTATPNLKVVQNRHDTQVKMTF